jgi:foldase protein PrsA
MKRLSLLLISLFVLVACGDTLDPSAATVNGEKIAIEDVEKVIDQLRASENFAEMAKQAGGEDKLERQAEQARLSQLINRAVLEPIAEERGLEVTDTEVTERLDSIKESPDFAEEGAFEDFLASQGLSEDQARELIHDSILEEKLREDVTKDLGPSDEELQAYYDEHEADFTQYDASHILVKKEAEARDLLRQLRAAPEGELKDLFAELAKKNSTDTGSGANGGNLGLAPASQYVPPFAEALGKLEIGVVSDPVKTEFGFHLILVLDKKVATFEESKETIAQQLGGPAIDEAYRDFILAAYEEADIRVNPKYGEFSPEERRVKDADPSEVPGVTEDSPAPATSASPEAETPEG